MRCVFARAVLFAMLAAIAGCASIIEGIGEGIAEGLETAVEQAQPDTLASCEELARRYTDESRYISDLVALAQATGRRVRPEAMAEALARRDAIADEMARRCQ